MDNASRPVYDNDVWIYSLLLQVTMLNASIESWKFHLNVMHCGLPFSLCGVCWYSSRSFDLL